MTDPIDLFAGWLDEAAKAEPNDPEAAALATADARGRPSVRMVLVKAIGADGFTFFTNGESRKALDLAANPRAALLFHWKSLRRQVRIEGPVEAVSAIESDRYFATRGRDSKIGAWASDQSRPLTDRDTFEARFAQMQQRFANGDVPRPPHWGGYCISPETIEFWSDRPHRLHHRRLFTRLGSGWSEGLLYP